MDLLDVSKFFDGMLIAAGALASILFLSITRSLGIGGAAGTVYGMKVLFGWHKYRQGKHPDIVNVTVNTTRGGRLTIDTVVADHLLPDIWPNLYHVMKVKRAAKETSAVSPVLRFETQSGYRLTYDPLISLITEQERYSIDFAIGTPCTEHRFVLALTFERNCPVRSQHFRVMMINEEELRRFPKLVSLERAEQGTRFETLRLIAQEYATHPERFGIVKVWRPITKERQETLPWPR